MGDESMKQVNRFISMHAISFCNSNMMDTATNAIFEASTMRQMELPRAIHEARPFALPTP
jgi:hypothetical protein